MKLNCNRICELVIVTAVSSLLLLMVPSGSMAAQGDWGIYHNWEYVSNHGYCSIIATDGVNHVEGTFEWGSSGVSFQYTYGGWSSTHWYNAPADWQSGYYIFDFNTDWDYAYSGLFIILPTLGSQYAYWCTTPT